MKLPRFLTAASALVVLATLACSDDSNKSPTEPEIPEPPETVTQTFQGSVPQFGEGCHFFALGADGSITTQITDLQPLTSLTMGLALGQPGETNPEACARVVTDSSVRLNEVFLSSGNPVGNYCVCIFDVGNIFPDETVRYTLDVTHPK